MKWVLFSILLSTWTIPGVAALNEEHILVRKAALTAERVHKRNIVLLGVDPKTCKPTDNKKLLISQLGKIKSGKLNHCPEYVQEKLKALDEEIKNVEKGILVYAPVKIPLANSAPVEHFQDSSPMPELNQVFEDNLPAVSSKPGSSEVDYTGLNEEQRSRILIFQEKNRNQYVNYDDDNLFLKLSNAYMRNLPRLMTKPSVKENQE